LFGRLVDVEHQALGEGTKKGAAKALQRPEEYHLLEALRDAAQHRGEHE
jgi:hypothetical protein